MPLTIKTLQSTHPEYDASKMRRYQALYCGGDAFKRQMDSFLIKRRSEEKSDGLIASSLYDDRKKWAQYINRAGGLVDWFKAAVFPDVRIVVEGAQDERAMYWLGLNDDADGRGRPLAMLMRDALVHSLVQGRGYFSVHFDLPEAEPGLPGSFDAKLRTISPMSVIDWDCLPGGDRLAWVKVFSRDPVREPGEAYGPTSDVLYRWVVITDTQTVTYEYRCSGTESLTDETEVPGRVSSHAFGVLPVFDVRVMPDQWVMDRISDVVVSLFNAEAALNYALMMQAYAQPVFTLSDTAINRVMASESNAIKLAPGEKFEYITPKAQVFEPLYRNIDRLKASFYEVLQAMAINATTIPQAGRASGAAWREMRDPLQVLLGSFATPVIEALNRWITAVKHFRGEDDLDITVEMASPGAAGISDMEKIINGTQAPQPA